MITFKIKKEWIEESIVKAKDIGRLNNSIEDGEGNFVGCLGEFCVNEIIQGELVNSRDFDILSKDEYRWEVKTIARTVPPRKHYMGSLCHSNTKQNCHAYVFVSVENNELGTVMGWMPKVEFLAKSVFYPTGSNEGNHGVKSGCYKMEYGTMYDVELLATQYGYVSQVGLPDWILN